MAEVPSLNVIDVSNGNPFSGTINASAMSIEWLQEILDFFHTIVPWAGIVTSTSVTFTDSTATIALESDFILDVKDGLLITVNSVTRRLRRVGLQNLISMSLNTNEGVPLVYCVQATNFRVTPTPDQTYTGTLWYYARPSALSSSTVPSFPSDLTLIEAVRIRAMEWIRAVPPGTALGYCETQVAKLRKSGLGHEPESMDIPLDPYVYRPQAGEPGWAWMGSVGG
jgi:hypothetical protein